MRSCARALPVVAAASLLAATLLSSCGDSTQGQDPIGAAGSTADSSAEGSAGDGQAGKDASQDVVVVPDAQDAKVETVDASTDPQSKDQTSPDALDDQVAPTDTAGDNTAAEAGPDGSTAIDCLADPPTGSPEPAPWPVFAGTCPALVLAPATNTIQSSGASREFMLAIPSGMTATEKVPVVVVWHWLGGSPGDAFSALDIQAAVDLHRFIAIIPTSKGDVLLKWPFSILDSTGRMDEEFQFFDDMLGCVAAAHPNAIRHCVSSLGVSAGALFTDQLASARANRLASYLSISGGVGTTARAWGKPSHKLPGLVLWGGPNDDYNGLYDFNKGSLDLEDALVGEGNFFVECIHNCGHAVPPFEAPPGGTQFDALWQFVFDHPYWLGTGASPYKNGVPAVFPSWCGPGKGGAVPRPDGSPC